MCDGCNSLWERFIICCKRGRMQPSLMINVWRMQFFVRTVYYLLQTRAHAALLDDKCVTDAILCENNLLFVANEGACSPPWWWGLQRVHRWRYNWMVVYSSKRLKSERHWCKHSNDAYNQSVIVSSTAMMTTRGSHSPNKQSFWRAMLGASLVWAAQQWRPHRTAILQTSRSVH